MSDENTENVAEETHNQEIMHEMAEETADQVESDAERVRREQVVAWESHQKLLNQRKADQKKARELEAEVQALRESIKQQENAKLEEKQEYKKLYEATRQELEAKKREQEERDKIIVNKEKQAALAKELGGLKNDAYFKFAELENIVIDDSGQVDQNSVRLEANRFRQAFPELIASTPSVRVNSQAPSGNGPVLNQPKSPREMSASEREAIKRQMLLDKVKK